MFTYIVARLASVTVSMIYLVRMLIGDLTIDEIESLIWRDMVAGELELTEARWSLWWSPLSGAILELSWEDWQREQRLARLRGE